MCSVSSTTDRRYNHYGVMKLHLTGIVLTLLSFVLAQFVLFVRRIFKSSQVPATGTYSFTMHYLVQTLLKPVKQ